MSSSQPFMPSSPLQTSPSRRKKSKFTYRNLAQLATYAGSPLRVIAHLDLDAFYAQVEMVRLGIEEDKPLAVQQWQGLIAINYPARAFGLNRHITITEAKKLCPDLICQHVATWREGDEKWAYHDDAFKNIATHKVSLDPYRLESRRILACIKDCLPKDLQRVEKASVDEVFMDLSAQVHATLLERYPELKGPAPYDDLTEQLPLPPTTCLDWKADALVDLDRDETETDDPDWDDIAMLIGSEIVRTVRAAIREKLKYTCSAGIAQNKMLSKLGSAHKKPNQQTVIRNRAVKQFLSGFKFTKIRNLGGKTGEEVVKLFNTDMVSDLLLVPMEQLKQKLGEETGTWVYNVIRGIDASDVNSRTQIKSMLSAKSFRPSINTPDQANRWLRIFAADIHSRLVEEGVLENKRRPKTINLHHKHGVQTKSRQAPIPQGKKMDETLLYELAKTLLNQIMLDGRVWPCSNLSLSVGGFEDGVTGNMGIGAFLVKGNEARTLNNAAPQDPGPIISAERSEKRRRVGDAGIQKFFVKTDSAEEQDDDFGGEQSLPEPDMVFEEKGHLSPNKNFKAARLPREDEATRTSGTSAGPSALKQSQITDFLCNRCNQALDCAEAFQNHQDWHFAKDLQDEDRLRRASPAPSTASGNKRGAVSKKRGNGRGRPEKGQSKLTFG
ncbi:DNA-directed DNA polymerase eta rad30 [Ciborinia camelliae]|nr:DNA-directed DNA polymerase eta rad30 [Ciborinia camelliae]